MDGGLLTPFHMGSFSGSGCECFMRSVIGFKFFVVSPERREAVVLGAGSMEVYIPDS